MNPTAFARWWSGPASWLAANLIPVTAGLLCVYMIVAVGWSLYSKGRASMAPTLAVAEGHAAAATTNDANAQGALTATSERHRVEVTIREIERETGNVVAEARITGDTAAAVAGWSSGINRMRSLGEASPNADPDERPRMPR